MLQTTSVVFTIGLEGYHLESALEKFAEAEVLTTLAQNILDAGETSNYTAAMRRATELVEHHHHVQNGSSVCRDTHQQLKARQKTRANPLSDKA
jgi:hypothetical protein